MTRRCHENNDWNKVECGKTCCGETGVSGTHKCVPTQEGGYCEIEDDYFYFDNSYVDQKSGKMMKTRFNINRYAAEKQTPYKHGKVSKSEMDRDRKSRIERERDNTSMEKITKRMRNEEMNRRIKGQTTQTRKDTPPTQKDTPQTQKDTPTTPTQKDTPVLLIVSWILLVTVYLWMSLKYIIHPLV